MDSSERPRTDWTASDWEQLKAAAVEAASRAYVPYSRYPVGAAAKVTDLDGDGGRVVTGCNVENASYGLSLCAECAMVGQLHLSGGGRLTHFVCVNKLGEVIMPCGRCRQLLYEFRAPGMQLWTVTGIRPITEVLPDAFGPSDLEHVR